MIIYSLQNIFKKKIDVYDIAIMSNVRNIKERKYFY